MIRLTSTAFGVFPLPRMATRHLCTYASTSAWSSQERSPARNVAAVHDTVRYPRLALTAMTICGLRRRGLSRAVRAFTQMVIRTKPYSVLLLSTGVGRSSPARPLMVGDSGIHQFRGKLGEFFECLSTMQCKNQVLHVSFDSDRFPE